MLFYDISCSLHVPSLLDSDIGNPLVYRRGGTGRDEEKGRECSGEGQDGKEGREGNEREGREGSGKGKERAVRKGRGDGKEKGRAGRKGKWMGRIGRKGRKGKARAQKG